MFLERNAEEEENGATRKREEEGYGREMSEESEGNLNGSRKNNYRKRSLRHLDIDRKLHSDKTL